MILRQDWATQWDPPTKQGVVLNLYKYCKLGYNSQALIFSILKRSGGLSENGPWLLHLNVWFPVGGQLGRMRRCILAGRGSRRRQAQPPSHSSLLPSCELSATAVVLCLPAHCHAACRHDPWLTLRNKPPLNASFISCLGHVSLHSNRTVAKQVVSV